MATLTLGYVSPHVAVPSLAIWECAIGLGVLTDLVTQATILRLAPPFSGGSVPLTLPSTGSAREGGVMGNSRPQAALDEKRPTGMRLALAHPSVG